VVAVHGRADTYVVEVGGENYVFAFQRGIISRQLADQVCRLNFIDVNLSSGFERNRERKMRQRLVFSGQGGDVSEGVS